MGEKFLPFPEPGLEPGLPLPLPERCLPAPLKRAWNLGYRWSWLKSRFACAGPGPNSKEGFGVEGFGVLGLGFRVQDSHWKP